MCLNLAAKIHFYFGFSNATKKFLRKLEYWKIFVFLQPQSGRVAEQSGTGLQNLLKRCDSARDLNKTCCISMQ